eukprot:9364489-Alexandrium_andersonii.AAC.1
MLQGLPEIIDVLWPLGNSRVASSPGEVSKLPGSPGLPGEGPGLAVEKGDGAILLPHGALFLVP